MKKKEVVINRCFGGFGLSDKAYERLIELGIPVRPYIEEPLNPKTGLYDIKIPNNEGKIIFDRTLYPSGKKEISYMGRYWETWLSYDRENPLLVQVVKELGNKANGRHAELKIVKIPADVDYEIDEYDGIEHIAETHQTWS